MLDVVKSASARFVALAEAAEPKAGTDVPATPGWTVRDLVAHVAAGLPRYAAGLRGRADWAESPEGLRDWNVEGLGRVAGADYPELLDQLREVVPDVIAALADHDPADTLGFHAGVVAPVSCVGGILVGEFLLHGDDLAAATRLPWRIPPREAAVAFGGTLPLLPTWVHPERSAGHSATYEIRLRQGLGTHRWTFADGSLATDARPDAKVDCHLSGDAAALMLVFYRRRSPWWGAATGKVMAWGRRPWLAFTLASRFHQP
jgi:uncharacterized protein (TIGR03083 family)